MANDVLLGRWNEMVVFLGHTSLPFFKIVLRSHVFHYEREELSTWEARGDQQTHERTTWLTAATYQQSSHNTKDQLLP
jgi:hypothetical protein